MNLIVSDLSSSMGNASTCSDNLSPATWPFKFIKLVSQEPFALKLEVQKPKTFVVGSREQVCFLIYQPELRPMERNLQRIYRFPVNTEKKMFFNQLALPGSGLNSFKSTKISFPENNQKLDSLVQQWYVVVPNISY